MKRTLAVWWLAACCAAGAGTPQRIVSLSPNVTELLYGIGAFPQVVGVSDYCSYPPEARKLPSVGGWHDPSLEKVTALRPDLLVVDAAQAPFVEGAFRDLGLRLLAVPTQTVADIYRAMAELGRATGHEQQASRLAEATRLGLQRVALKTAGRPRPKVVLIIDRTPGTLDDLYTATAGSYLAELVEIAGGRIAVPAVRSGYAKLSQEDLLAANPDVILDFIQTAEGRLGGDPLHAWRAMPELAAVRTGRVYSANQDFVLHASQRVVEAAELFARLIHPEVR